MGRGWGLRIQIGRTTITPHRWLPVNWEIQTSLMAPNLYGLGVWITRDMWATQNKGGK